MRLLLLLFSVMTTPALAVTTAYQTLTPASGQNEFKLGVGYRSINAEGTNGVTSEATGPSVPFSYYYGLFENQSLGVETGYSSYNQNLKGSGNSVSAKVNGMEDVFIGYKGNFDLGVPTLFVSGGLNIPPEKSKSNHDNGDSNLSSGQMAIVGTLGITIPVSSYSLGILGTYKAAQEGDAEITSLGTTYSGKFKNGSSYQITAYGEIQNSYHTNLSVTYGKVYDQNFTSDSGVFTSTKTGSDLIRGAFTFRYNISGGFELLPVLAYTTMLNKDQSNLSSYNDFLVGVEGRLLF